MADTLTDQIFEGASDEEISSNIFTDAESSPEAPFIEMEPPDRYGTRTSGEPILSGVVAIVGAMLVNRNIDPPVGRTLTLEAPLAGNAIDKVIADTWIDRLLQPLFAKSDNLEELGAIIALPIMVGILERKPEMSPIILPPLEEVLTTVLEELDPIIRKRKTKRRRVVKSTMAEVADTFEIPKGMDPIQAILGGYIFQMNQEENETAG